MRAPHLIMLTVSSGHIDDYSNVQSDYGVIPGDTLGISPSVTAYISLAELTGTITDSIYIMNIGGKVKLNGQIFLKDFSYVSFTMSSDYGLLDSACTYQPFNTQDNFSNTRVSGLQFKNCGDYVFHTINPRPWTGSIADANHDDQFDNISIQNCADGWWVGETTDGFWNNINCFGWTCDSLQETCLFHINRGFKWRIHDSRFTHTALSDTTDAGLVTIHGSLDFYRNYTNYTSGSIIRWFGLSLVADKSKPGDTSWVYFNVTKNSRKYGPYQINTQYGDTTSTYFRPGSIVIAFNTASRCSDMGYHTSDNSDFGSAFADFYHCKGHCLIYSNAFEGMHFDHGQSLSGVNYLIHNGAGDTPFPDTLYNIRVLDRDVTFIDTVNMIPFNPSVLANAAPALDYLSSSFNGVFRTPGQLTYAGAYNFYVQLIGPRKDKRRNKIVIHKP